jgi:hypothetical protein
MRTFLPGLFALLLLGSVTFAADFVRDVKPILNKHCISCHGPEKQRASLRTDTARALLEGGSSGPAVVAGKPAESLLFQAVTAAEGVKVMPPKEPRLSAEEVAVLRKWIETGAKAPADESITLTRPKSSHWAFQSVTRSPEPKVLNPTLTHNAIDRFIHARLDKEGIRPAPQADRVTLIRRVSLDLLGLPPTPEEVQAFLADVRPDAYERLVDRLLASPHFGERWGRIWLDQARYSDSNGYSIDAPRAIWKYRDWVIAALNEDKPFNEFTIEQLAGDLLPRATMEQKVATGFHRNTQINEEGGIDKEQFRVEAVVDRVNTTGAVWLGLTVGCAQCHDHKFDPLSQKEYYQLYAFFNNSDDPKLTLLSPEIAMQRNRKVAQQKELEKRLLSIEHLTPATLEHWQNHLGADQRKQLPPRIQKILAIAINGRTVAQDQELWKAYRRVDQVRHVIGSQAGPFAMLANMHLLKTREKLESEIDALRKSIPAAPTTLVVNERAKPRMTTIQLGGDFLRKGATVKPEVPGVLPELKSKGSPTRLDLARWLVDGNNPLTGRVLVNRLWQQYFGLGLVETDNDFGTQGTKPSHPELLDYLADEVVRRNWQMKEIHRLIVTSATYRQSSRTRPELRDIDARNVLLARQNRLRLDAEIVRDVTLAASGLLNPAIGGPSVFPLQPKGVYSLTQVPKNWEASLGPDRWRRGMYTYFWRSAPHPSLTVFDAPDATVTCSRRNRSNTPLQALTLLNDETHLEAAKALAVRILSEKEERMERAFRLSVARQPTSRELTILRNLLEKQRSSFLVDRSEANRLTQGISVEGVEVPELAAWVQVGRALLNLDETITRE